MFCQACGAKLVEGTRFCGSCGAPQAAQKEPEQPTMVRPADSSARPPVAPPVETPTPPIAPPQDAPRPVAGGYDPAGRWVSYDAPPTGGGPAGQAQPPTQYGAPGFGQYGQPPTGGRPPAGGPPRNNDRLPLWIGLAATAIIIIGAIVAAVWILVIDKDDPATTSTTKVAHTTTTSKPVTTTSSATSTTGSTAPSTTVTLPLGAPGDSPGQWAELDIPDLPSGAYAVAVSDEAMLIDAEDAGGFKLYAYIFETKELIELPVDAPDFGGEDLEGLTAVWWEGSYNEDTFSYTDESIYAYRLPKGPKVKIAGGGGSVYYPQIANDWVTWAQQEPWKDNPEEYSFIRIFGVTIGAGGEPQGDVVELVPAATSYSMGDSTWTYSLSDTHLVWENATAVDVFDPGVYSLDLTTFLPEIVKTQVWRPSTSNGKVVYSDGGLMVAQLGGGTPAGLDPQGDFPSAAPTFAAYFRPREDSGFTVYDIVARGYAGAYEQTLGTQEDPPWLSPWLSTSANRVAFIVDGFVHVFEWQGPKTL